MSRTRRALTLTVFVGLLGVGSLTAICSRSAAPEVTDPTIVVRGAEGERPDPPAGASNLVLVVGCTVRKDQLSVYGARAPTTPFLSSLAKDGARFLDVINAAPWTRAASAALLTGHHAVSVGMVEPTLGRNERALPERVVTLAEHLRSRGWATGGMTTNPNLNSVYGFAQGYDAYRQPERVWAEDRTRMSGERAVPMALEVLDGLDPQRPFFLLVVLTDSHAPFAITETERALFADPAVPDNVVEYRGVLRRVDQAVAALDAGLALRGFDAHNTVLAVVNDHGEGLSWPTHHGKGHGRFLAPSVVGGVFVARGPQIASGHDIGGLVSQIDVAPTLAAVVGAGPFAGPGSDWSAQLRGDAGTTDRSRAYSDTWFRESDRAAVYTASAACQVDSARRGTRRETEFVTGCFDRQADPLHEHVVVRPALAAELTAWRAARLVEAVQFGDAPRVTPGEALDAQLQALGYTDGGAP